MVEKDEKYVERTAEEIATSVVKRVLESHMPEVRTEAIVDRVLEKLAEGRKELVRDTVEEVFLKMGIDPSNVNETSALKTDLQFLHNAHRGAREIKSVAIKTCVGAFFTFLIGLIGLGLHQYFRK